MLRFADYLKMRARLGIERTVVVQPSAYGKDNRCTLEAMAAIGPSARGIAVVDETVTDAELDRLTKLGIRGIRFFMLSGAPLPLEILETMSARVAPFGWHVVFQMDGRDLADQEALLGRLTSNLIIDHTGKFLEPVAPDHPGMRTILRLLDKGRTWTKLSAPYETSKAGPPFYDDVGKLAKALAKAAPERILWASNWPHPTPGVDSAGRRGAARHAAGLGARRSGAAADAQRQSGRALRLLAEFLQQPHHLPLLVLAERRQAWRR